MGHDLQDTFVIRMQNILRIAHGLREATVTSDLTAYSLPRPSDSQPPVISIDSISLPSPPPLLPSLIEAGVSPEIASAASKIYLGRAEQLKQRIEESVTTAYCKVARIPASTSALSPDLLMKKVSLIFTEIYVQRLEKWKEESIQRIKRASTRPVKTAPRNSRTFNYDCVPLLEHFFEENPFPTHADKIFLAKKSNMQYKQIHVWFQNRRNRTKKEGNPLRKKPTCEGVTKPPGKLYERMEDHMVRSDSQAPKTSKDGLPEGATKTEIPRNNALKHTLTSSSPPHAFPSSYPPNCHYDPFPCISGPSNLSRPEWRRVSCGRLPPPLSTSIGELAERFSQLNVRDETRFKGSSKLHSYAATAAITVIPSGAPHPSLVVCEYCEPAYIVQRHPIVRAPVSSSEVFKSPSPASESATLVPLSISPNKGDLPGKRKIAPLPRRFPGQMRNTFRDTTPPESSSTSSASTRLFSMNSESRGCSFSSISSLSMPSDIASTQELPHSSESLCRTQFDSSIYPCDLGDAATLMSAFVS